MPTPAISRLVGVYDADGTLRGELAYVIGARLGRRHCALCDITHGTVRERPEWRTCRAGLPVPFETYHRDDQPDPVGTVLRGVYPAVAAQAGDDWVVLLGPDDLDACGASPDALVTSLEAAAQRLGLTWPQ